MIKMLIIEDSIWDLTVLGSSNLIDHFINGGMWFRDRVGCWNLHLLNDLT
jgi:hypothetical protein